jgi:hypothetical protein
VSGRESTGGHTNGVSHRAFVHSRAPVKSFFDHLRGLCVTIATSR